jgi:hypothetical protein
MNIKIQNVKTDKGHSNNTLHFLAYFRPLPHVSFGETGANPPGLTSHFDFPPKKLEFFLPKKKPKYKNKVQKFGNKCHVTLLQPLSPL